MASIVEEKQITVNIVRTRIEVDIYSLAIYIDGKRKTRRGPYLKGTVPDPWVFVLEYSALLSCMGYSGSIAYHIVDDFETPPENFLEPLIQEKKIGLRFKAGE